MIGKFDRDFAKTYGRDLLTTQRKVTDVRRRVHVICKRPCEFDGGIANVESAADVIRNMRKYAFLDEIFENDSA